MKIRGYVIDAQRQVYSSVNVAMVTAYRNIGKAIYEVHGESDRASWGLLECEDNGDGLTGLLHVKVDVVATS